MKSSDPLEADIKDIIIDFDQVTAGFVFLTRCNYPEAVISGEIVIDNVTVTQTIPRSDERTNGLIHTYSPQNITIMNSFIVSLTNEENFHVLI